MIRSILATTLALSLACASHAQRRAMGEPSLDGDEFVKRFTASYGVLAEREPPLTDIEIAILRKMAPIMRVDKGYAQTLLQSLTVGEKDSSATFNYLLGNIYFENEQYFLAEEQYKTAIEKHPDFQRAWTNLGVLKLRGDDTRSALIAFLKAVELGDSKPHTFGMLGYCHFREGNFISAEVAYDRAMLSEPNNLEWLEGKAEVYLASERFIEALRMQDELISRRPEVVDYWLVQTNTYLMADNLKGAARNLEIVRSMGRADFRSLFLLGSLYAKLGMHGPSSDAYIAAARLAEAGNLDFLAKASKQLLHNRQYAAARELFDTLSTHADDLTGEALFDYKSLAADFAARDDEHGKAIALLEEAEKLNPLDGALLIRLARLHAQNGNRDKAYFLLDRAEGDPDAEYNAVVTRARFLIDEKRFAESQIYVGRALKLQSSEAMQNLYDQVREAASTRG